MKTTITNSYIAQFDDLLDGDPWLGESFAKKLDALTEAQIFTKPKADVHSVAEVISHVIAWRNEEIRRLETGGEKQLFMDSPENWVPNETLKSQGWPALYNQLKTSQLQIHAFLATKNDDFIFAISNRDNRPNDYFISGLLQHDAYHLGQIGLIVKMVTSKKSN